FSSRRRHTRFSRDWSSDVCSSDLGREWPKDPDPTFMGYSIGKWLDADGDGRFDILEIETRHLRLPRTFDQTGIAFHADGKGIIRSEERRVGKECRSRCWSEQ